MRISIRPGRRKTTGADDHTTDSCAEPLCGVGVHRLGPEIPSDGPELRLSQAWQMSPRT
jgi:hypothetical protein